MRARSALRICLAALSFSLALAAADARAEEPLLTGPHPFLKQNELDLQVGYGVANTFSGLRAQAGYGMRLDGSLWLDLRLDFLDATHEPQIVHPKCGGCGDVSTFVHVAGGVKYKLQTNIPVVPYGSLLAGPIYLFRADAGATWGLGARAAVGAHYFLHDWLGFGIELGGMMGRVATGDNASLKPAVLILDLGLGAEIQF